MAERLNFVWISWPIVFLVILNFFTLHTNFAALENVRRKSSRAGTCFTPLAIIQLSDQNTLDDERDLITTFLSTFFHHQPIKVIFQLRLSETNATSISNPFTERKQKRTKWQKSPIWFTLQAHSSLCSPITTRWKVMIDGAKMWRQSTRSSFWEPRCIKQWSRDWKKHRAKKNERENLITRGCQFDKLGIIMPFLPNAIRKVNFKIGVAELGQQTQRTEMPNWYFLFFEGHKVDEVMV